MKVKKITASIAVSMALAAVAGGASAASITTFDGPFAGTYSNFFGIDWAANGLAVVQGFDLEDVGDSTNITLDFWASAVAITDATQTAIPGATGGILFGDYELTAVAQLVETATCIEAAGGFCTQASFEVVSGFWEIYYDAPPDADRLAATGFDNGDRILAGTFNTGFAGVFTATATGGTGSNDLSGIVTFTNSTYISPDLLGTTVGTELKFGDSRTDEGGLPTATPFEDSITCDRDAGVICLQADANQSFTEQQVPEPGTLLLLGVGMLGLAAARRLRA